MQTIYRDKLLCVLRETLNHLERTTGSHEDPTLLELKASLIRTIAEQQLKAQQEDAVLS